VADLYPVTHGDPGWTTISLHPQPNTGPAKKRSSLPLSPLSTAQGAARDHVRAV
jgi:hypothetical protein